MFIKKGTRLFSIVSICCLLMVLSACGRTRLEKKLIGGWGPVGENGTVEFLGDGTVLIDRAEGKWAVAGNGELKLTVGGHPLFYEVISISSERMSLERDGKRLELKKRK